MGPGGSDLETKVDYICVNPSIISWEEASEHIGQTIAVEGVIVGTYYARNSKGKPTFLNFHMPYQGFLTCVIWGSDREKFVKTFHSAPEDFFLNECVVVEGLIEEYPAGSGNPEIVLEEPSQIRVIEK
jgi:micrococcal nuclease